ncbi:MAG: hypothetical protein F9K28_11520 [Bacteroidetes bacterium]|nr:MAG: hypothetical protein F9K28_11520 [Bacteroidota bacterium]MBZ0195622.1 PTS transporter subunit EIIB [Candidatus Kapabacteria bacterium]
MTVFILTNCATRLRFVVRDSTDIFAAGSWWNDARINRDRRSEWSHDLVTYGVKTNLILNETASWPHPSTGKHQCVAIAVRGIHTPTLRLCDSIHRVTCTRIRHRKTHRIRRPEFVGDFIQQIRGRQTTRSNDLDLLDRQISPDATCQPGGVPYAHGAAA